MIDDVKYSVNAGFFNAINKDRVYSADDMNRPYRRLISNGIFANPKGTASNDMQVFSTNNGMDIIVSKGDAIIGDKWFENPSDLIITISQNSEVLPRIDSIIAQVDKTQAGRTGSIVYRQGYASNNPVHPEINTTEDIVEIRIADIRISPSCVKVTQDLITDCRGSNECPWITSLIYQVDTSTLYSQWQAAYKKYYEDQEAEHDEYFEQFKNTMEDFFAQEEQAFGTWFDQMKEQLSEEAAGKLLAKINKVEDNLVSTNEKVEELTEDYTGKINDLKQIVVAPNAGAHNGIYRGKDITSKFYDGTLSQQIANQTFDDIFIGDYIIGQNSGRKYLVADINYRLYMGDAGCTTPHILMIPEKTMGLEKMNNSNTTVGGYVGSKMYISNLATYKNTIKGDFGAGHILKHRNMLTNATTNGYPSGGAWYDSEIELMNENMVYGTRMLGSITNGSNFPFLYTADKSQLALFRHRHDLTVALNDNDGRQLYWLRDIGSQETFCVVDSYGHCDVHNAIGMVGIRPAFLVY